MSEPTAISFRLYPATNTLDVWVQEPGKGVISFDPTQLPDKLADLLPGLTAAALAGRVAAEFERADALAELDQAQATIANQAEQIAQLQADMDEVMAFPPDSPDAQ